MQHIPVYCTRTRLSQCKTQQYTPPSKIAQNIPQNVSLLSFQGHLIESTKSRDKERLVGELTKEHLVLSHQRMQYAEKNMRGGPVLVLRRDPETGKHFIEAIVRRETVFDERPTPVTPPSLVRQLKDEEEKRKASPLVQRLKKKKGVKE